jgi:hypothetical protein
MSPLTDPTPANAEALAQRLREVDQARFPGHPAWESLGDGAKDTYRAMARAAIVFCREGDMP